MADMLKYHTKAVGVTFEGRQAVLSVMKGDEKLRVVRQLDNEYDKNAVAIEAEVPNAEGVLEWLPVGYIAKDKNEQIARSLDAGIPVSITIGGITGGKNGNSYGMNIALEYAKAPAKAVVKEEEKPAEPVVTKKQTIAVLEHILKAVGGTVPESHVEPAETIKYNSRLLGKSIELNVVNGHKRLEGYLSGSKFPDQFYKSFDDDRDRILDGMVAKSGAPREDIEAMWDLNRDASTGYGTAVHAALENYDTNYDMGEKLRSQVKKPTKKNPAGVMGPNKALSKNPFIKKIVEDFQKKYGGSYNRFCEEFIWDPEFKLCGSVDRIKVVDLKKKVIRIQDYKTDGDIHEKTYQKVDSIFYPLTQGDTPKLGKELLDLHWLQLSFYAFILQRAGWTVEGLDIFWLNPEKLVKGVNAWEEFSHDVIDIMPALITA